MAFFDDLALGSRYHKAMCADRHLTIEPMLQSPEGRTAFDLIVDAARKAAQLENLGFTEMADIETGFCQSACIEIR